MTLSELAIRRPVFAWMLMLGLILFGAVSLERLGVSQLPDVDFPVLNVSVDWPGAAPEVVEAEIVDQLEQAIISVQGIRDIISNVRQGSASITIEFELDRDVDVALQEVQAYISRVRLPLDVDPPRIRKNNPDDQPIIWLGISSTRTLRDLTEFVDLSIKDRFQMLPGVGEVLLGGFTERNLRIWVDHKKLNKFELTILDVQRAIEAGHIETAAGRIENDEHEFNLRVMGEGLSPEQVGDILILQRGGRPIYGSNIRIRDIARVEDGLNDIRRISRANGVPSIGLGIRKQRGANAVAVGEEVHRLLDEIKKTLPEDIQIGVNFDSTTFVKEAIEETEFTLILSALATAVVCFLFLGSLSPTFNILLSIPTSIVGSFMVIYFFGFTINFFTLLGLTLAIGIVVDDAIMVLENIYRHRQMGKNGVQAALDGSKEITFAAVAASVAVIAIFIPVAFMEGVIGKFFLQFGVTITAAVALSLLEAITLTPMRAAQLTGGSYEERGLARLVSIAFEKLAYGYKVLLQLCLKMWWLVITISVGFFIWSLSYVDSLRKEFIPPQDQSVFTMRFETPIGSSLEFTSQKIKEAEEFISRQPEVVRVFTAVGGFGGGEVNTGTGFVSLTPPTERKVTQQEFMDRCRTELKKLTGLKVVVQDLSTRGFTAQRGFPVEFNIRGPEWKVLKEKSDEIQAQLEASGLVADMDDDYRIGQPEVRVWPLRSQAATRGVSMQDIANTVNAAMGGIRQGKFTNDGRRYDVRIRLEADERVKAEDISALKVRNDHGELVNLSELIKVETVPTLQTITRRARERSISVFANVAPGKSQAAALARAEELGKELLPPGYRLFLGGGAQTFMESFRSLYFVLWMGIVVAYMILASQFNSYIHPFTVLLALPFSITGAFLALHFSDQSINLFSLIGIILLMGIVKKNSILLVEFANVKREEKNLSAKDAMLAAGPIRLRPILMTSFATIAAALPPALAIGPGAESRIPLSVTIVGGVIVSTFFSLLVVPCAYHAFSYLERRKKHPALHGEPFVDPRVATFPPINGHGETEKLREESSAEKKVLR